LALIDMFPNQNPYKRKILAKLTIGKSIPKT
jgi:hypothetical protein